MCVKVYITSLVTDAVVMYRPMPPDYMHNPDILIV